LLAILLLLSCASFAGCGKPHLTVSVIDVGQGDSILIQSPNGKNILIDAGDSSANQPVAAYLQTRGVSRIDLLVATHPHSDHIGGMETIIQNFTITSVYMPKVAASTKTYADLLAAIQNKGLQINTAKAGVSVNLDSDLNVQILAPNSTYYDDLNNYSVLIKITYGKNSFLFTGDASDSSEKEMIASGADLKADVLKVGHHGSTSACSEAFLNAVKPTYAVISVGSDNSFGHPAPSTLANLKAIGAIIYRTDLQGTIVITSDGQNIHITTGR
jgi:competence protein ComEC